MLAKEIGLEESEVLLTLEAEIQQHGTRRNNARMIARDDKQLAELFPWCKRGHAKKALEALRDKNYIVIDDEGPLFNDTTRWYALNWKQIKTLDSIVVMDDDEIKEAHEPKEKAAKQPLGTNGFSRAHQILFGAFIKACDFRQELLTPRDKGEIGQAVKKLLAMYAGRNIETSELEEAVLGFRVWWIEDGKKFRTERNAPRPTTILSNWGKYETAIRQRGRMPVVPKEWL